MKTFDIYLLIGVVVVALMWVTRDRAKHSEAMQTLAALPDSAQVIVMLVGTCVVLLVWPLYAVGRIYCRIFVGRT